MEQYRIKAERKLTDEHFFEPCVLEITVDENGKIVKVEEQR